RCGAVVRLAGRRPAHRCLSAGLTGADGIGGRLYRPHGRTWWPTPQLCGALTGDFRTPGRRRVWKNRPVRNPYREVLALPGALAFSAAGLLARFAVPMMSIGIVLMLSELTGSYTTAGTVSATFVLSQAAGAPQLSRLVDRFGQARVMRPSLAVSALALVALIVAAVNAAPLWVIYGCAVLAGLTTGSMGSLVRARWTNVTETPHQLHRAFSLESSLDEFTFVVGPVVATALATSVAPWSATATCAILLVGGGFTFLALRGTEPAPHPRTAEDPQPGAPVIRSPAVLGLVVVFMFVGGIFGASEVAVVSFTDELGRAGAAGPL